MAAGAKAAFDQAIPLLARGGTAVIVGMPPTGVMASYDPGELAGASQKIVGSKMGSCRVREDVPRLASLYAEGKLELDSLVSQRFPLADINEAIAASRDGDALRNVIVF